YGLAAGRLSTVISTVKTLLSRAAVFICLTAMASLPSRACDELAKGQTLWVRLSTPISTYTAKAGDPVHAVLTRDAICGGDVVLPMGTPLTGVVRSLRKVGLGFRHETASLELEFTGASPRGELIPLKARVDEVENARESIKNGVIQGVRSSDTFQGRINSRLIHLPTWNPYSDPVLIVFKSAFPVFPEPEIYYPAGTDMRLSTTEPLSIASTREAEPDTESTAQMERIVREMPVRVKTKEAVNADLINIVFIGDREQVESAFQSAGWDSSDEVSRRAVMHNLYALLNHSGYSRQPMTTFYLDGTPEDMNWQKSLNSYDRRDHLRIWRWQSQDESGRQMWISSSTHDTGAVLAVKHKGFMHHIDSDVDEERETVLRDLTFAGCVDSVSYVPRPSVQNQMRNATGDEMRTDGDVALITLKQCKPAMANEVAASQQVNTYRPGNRFYRFARRQVLTFRNDIFRANIIYGAYDGGRMAFTAMRRRPSSPMSPSVLHYPPGESISSQRYEETACARPVRPYNLRTIH
ncbi:MAG TPA: LssY C-terminal domain-containing protein, partial [Edaphobacter sp.]